MFRANATDIFLRNQLSVKILREPFPIIPRLKRGDDREVLQGRGVALHGAARGYLLEDAAHDLAAAGLRQARGEAHVIGTRKRADLLGDMGADVLLELAVRPRPRS